MVHGHPLNLILDGRACLVLGASAEGAVRARALLDAGARVTVVGEHPVEAMVELVRSRGVALREREFRQSDLDGMWLVVQADQDEALATVVSSACEARRLFFCAIDQPAHSSYSHLALARAGALTIAIGTEGRAPALGRRLRQELTRLLEESRATEHVDRLARLRDTTPSADRRAVLGNAVAKVHFTGTLSFDDDPCD